MNRASISDMHPPELGENTFLLFGVTQYAVLCLDSPRELIKISVLKSMMLS